VSNEEFGWFTSLEFPIKTAAQVMTEKIMQNYKAIMFETRPGFAIVKWKGFTSSEKRERQKAGAK
jgi:hypothetical protein